MTEDPQEGQEGDSSERGHGYGFIRLENEIVLLLSIKQIPHTVNNVHIYI